MEPLLQPEGESTQTISRVHLTPGPRTAWHSHDGGQTLWVTEGHGLVQARGEKIVSRQAGDVHTTPDGLEHWHGATPDHLMSHLSITQGSPNWGDHVTDEEYSAG
jgi:quercetin dioxygenase-like cupin family protein